MSEPTDDTAPEETPKEEVLTIKLRLAEIPVKLEGPNGVEDYTLREMPGKDRDVFLNENASRVKPGPSGSAGGLRDFTGVQSMLIVKCLFDSQGKRVSRQIIDAWPCSAQTALFKKCVKLNALDDDEADAKKG